MVTGVPVPFCRDITNRLLFNPAAADVPDGHDPDGAPENPYVRFTATAPVRAANVADAKLPVLSYPYDQAVFVPTDTLFVSVDVSIRPARDRVTTDVYDTDDGAFHANPTNRPGPSRVITPLVELP